MQNLDLTEQSIYSSFKLSKTDDRIPLYFSGNASLSLYNPQKDAENFVKAQKISSQTGMIVIAGAANGFHIREVAKTFPKAKILCIEANKESLDFLEKEKLIPPDVSNNPRIIFCTLDDFSAVLKNNYFPALDGDFCFAPLLSWSIAAAKLFAKNDSSWLYDFVNSTIKDISRDYAVQARFGKIWNKNILQNLLCIARNQEQYISPQTTEIFPEKTAAIIGAGPSLTKPVLLHLKEHRDSYTVFATDTVFPALMNAGIKPDLIVSIDAQQISVQHIIGQDCSNIVLAFDLCAAAGLVQYAAKNGASLLPFSSGHPMISWLNTEYHEKYGTDLCFTCSAGAGTVLHAATDLADQLGFRKMHIFGADFAYHQGKAYTSGTYIDTSAFQKSSKLNAAENIFSNLYFRAPLQPIEKISFLSCATILNESETEKMFTSEVLRSYGIEYTVFIRKLEAQGRKISFLNQRNMVRPDPSTNNHFIKKDPSPEITLRIEEIISDYQLCLENPDLQEKSLVFSYLPFIAWTKHSKPNADNQMSREILVKKLKQFKVGFYEF